MDAKQTYRGLDLFRVFAAILVIANHTSPFFSIDTNVNFFVTRILARIAVPFFFMITGHFVVNDVLHSSNANHTLRNYINKTMLVYGASILLYLPIGIYAGIYQELNGIGLIRMLVFDGPFYHLWYFPASIIGILLIDWMRRWLGLRDIMMVCAILYVLGLFGDSYYYLLQQGTVIQIGYDYAFMLFSYTRNGLFFAPIFILLGALLGRSAVTNKRYLLEIGLVLSFLLMTVEAYVVHHYELPRHDSMYFALIPTMLCWYQLLLRWNNDSLKQLRTITSISYIIHPAMIVVIRGVAKALGTTDLIINHSLIFFLAVLVSTFLAAFTLASIIKWSKKKDFHCGRAWIELDLHALEHNVMFLRSNLPPNCKLMPAIKANAYGHGAVLIARELNKLGINAFCVACVQEAIELRIHGIRGEILILGYTHPQQFSLLHQYHLTQTVVDYAYAKELNQYGRKIHVHIAVDTGMHRLGERSEHIDQICAIFEMKCLIVDGIFSHLAAADSHAQRDKEFTQAQIKSWNQVLATLEDHGYQIKKHLLGSYGLLNYPNLAGDYVRVGIALYGVFSRKTDESMFEHILQPVLTLKARVVIVKNIYQDESVGYGMDFTAQRDMQIATIAIGYADGLPRFLSNGVGEVLIHGCKASIIGRICMDQTIVDVSGIADVKAGDIAVLLGKTGANEINVADWAEQSGSISNEVLSRLGSRLERSIVH